MSRINFEISISRHPSLSQVLSDIQDWAKNNGVRILQVRRLARELAHLPAEDIAESLAALVDDGVAVQRYMFQEPSGVLGFEKYDAPYEVPEQVESRSGGLIDIDDGRVVSVYVGPDDG